MERVVLFLFFSHPLVFLPAFCAFKAACGLAAPVESSVGARFQSFTGGIETTGDCSGTSTHRETEAHKIRGGREGSEEREREREGPQLTQGSVR